MAQALLLLLKQRDPERDLDVLAPDWSLPIVSRMPQVRRGIAAQTGHNEIGLGKRWRISRELRQQGYDQAIILPRSLKAALIPWFASIERRTGFRGESRYGLINDVRPFDRDILDQTVKRFAALGLEPGESLAEIPNPVLRVSGANQHVLLDKLDIRGDRPVIAMMPGAEYGPAKCWPIEYFSELASLLVADGYDIWVLGSASDACPGKQIATQSAAINLCGKTSLADVNRSAGRRQAGCQQRLGSAAYCSRSWYPRARHLRLLYAAIHAAVDRQARHALSRYRMQPLFRAPLPAAASAVPEGNTASHGAQCHTRQALDL